MLLNDEILKFFLLRSGTRNGNWYQKIYVTSYRKSLRAHKASKKEWWEIMAGNKEIKSSILKND